jgi:bifunctional enzyme CysN/CysC
MKYLNRELLRFTTAGSVDDGKSTLIGRLLYDSKAIFQDQMDALEKSSKLRGEEDVNLALLTDGLRAEREQGITIDVAYRYFSTPRRKFIIADTPGHEQYTRNMVTGASTAHLAIILIDARKGVLTQSRRHGYIASLLGIPHLVVAVNKMDLVDWKQEIFDEIVADYTDFCDNLNIDDITFIPISALTGDNVVDLSTNMPWYEGRSVLHHLETVTLAGDRNLEDFRFPVQYVVRPTWISAASPVASFPEPLSPGMKSSPTRRVTARRSSPSSPTTANWRKPSKASRWCSLWKMRSISPGAT